MRKKTLIETNRYLQNSEKYSNSLFTLEVNQEAFEANRQDDSIWQ
jgi:hypothetical protein